jgi:hypothetical protein
MLFFKDMRYKLEIMLPKLIKFHILGDSKLRAEWKTPLIDPDMDAQLYPSDSTLDVRIWGGDLSACQHDGIIVIVRYFEQAKDSPRVCPVCQTETTSNEKTFCETCGTEIPPYTPVTGGEWKEAVIGGKFSYTPNITDVIIDGKVVGKAHDDFLGVRITGLPDIDDIANIKLLFDPHSN